MLETLSQKGLFFGLTQNGELVTVQELLERKLGRTVEYDESIAYIKRQQFLAGIKRHSQLIHRTI